MSGHVSRAELIEAICRVAAVENFESMRFVVGDCRKLLDRLREPPRRSDEYHPGPAKSPTHCRHGTHRFLTVAAADLYYQRYGYTTDHVIEMIAEGDIEIGPPHGLRPGQSYGVDADGRYWIQGDV